MIDFKIQKGVPYPLGVSIHKDSVNFAFCSERDDCTLILKNKKNKDILNIPFDKEYKCGNVHCLSLRYFNHEDYLYRFSEDSMPVIDPFSKCVCGNEKFGIKKEDYELFSSIVDMDDYDWEDDKKPNISFSDTIMYLLHIRGFSAHSSSKVKNKGCIEGILEKIDHIKGLGITSLEIMPMYEFEEYSPLVSDKKNPGNDAFVADKVNYWGFKEGLYYAPKASYSSCKDTVKGYRDFIKKLHKDNIEVIMQFYFPDNVEEYRIYDVLRFWLINYHLDGFHLKGNKIPFSFIAKDPLFSDTKLFYDHIPENDIYEASYIPQNRNLCVYSDSFMYQMRKVLKGDEDSLKDLIYYERFYPAKSACVNFITNYYGFTLNDLVSYDRKHNEDNGEKNCDGSDHNFSWNCGIEGKTRKRSVVSLRLKMMKNALFLVFSSKGVPLIFAGDEICNTQNGNNNPYCQDNSVSYINWNLNAYNEEMLEFTRELIRLRKNYYKLFLDKDFSMLDRSRIGYPDLSYHSDEAWKCDLATYNRHLGIMYSDYSEKDETISLLYNAFNFYWKEITFSLPYLPNDIKWECVFKTGEIQKVDLKEKENEKDIKYCIDARTCAVFIAKFKKASIKQNTKYKG